MAIQPEIPALGGGVSAHAADGAQAGPRAVRSSAPASSIRKSCSPACASSCSRLLAEGPLSAADIAARLAVPLDSTERLLEAAVSLQLVRSATGGPLRPGAPGCGAGGQSRRSAPWWSITACSTRICAIPWRCCAASGITRSSRIIGPIGQPEWHAPRPRPRWRAHRRRRWCAAGALERPGRRYGRRQRLHRARWPTRSRWSPTKSWTPIRWTSIAVCSTSAAATAASWSSRRAPRIHLRLMLFDLPPVARARGTRFETLGLGSRARAMRRRFPVRAAARGSRCGVAGACGPRPRRRCRHGVAARASPGPAARRACCCWRNP